MLKKNFRFVLNFFALMFVAIALISVKAEGLLDNEPVDVVIKYIDLSDKNLHRPGIKSIKKDEDNEELRYCLRSILENMPWVRKIFIIMPNEKVKYLKPYDRIKDKIVYVKDKDLIGFDSASSITFEFNLWRLKKFGCSQNFIYFNDDCFVGKPAKKSDFFYEQDGKIVPYVIYAASVGYGQYEPIRKFYEKCYYENSNRHTSRQFQYQQISSLMFLYKYFGRDIIAPRGRIGYFPHNALGQNLDESKEIYDLIKNHYQYPDACLKAIYREKHSLTMNTLYSFYFINKSHKKITDIDGRYIDLRRAKDLKLEYKLFCINKSGDSTYSMIDCIGSRIAMMKRFPRPTKYEIPEIADGVYEIRSALDENRVIDVQDASRKNGANIRLWEKNNTQAQRFEVKRDGKGAYTIKCMCSGKMMDVMHAGTTNETNIWQFQWNGTDAQKWYIVPLNDGFYAIVSKCNGLYVDVRYACTSLGTNIRCYQGNVTDAQKFKFCRC